MVYSESPTMATKTPRNGLSGFALANDPDYIRTELIAGWTQAYGRAPTAAELANMTQYVSREDVLTGGAVHVGLNDYWRDRFFNPNSQSSSSVSPGTDTLIGYEQNDGSVRYTPEYEAFRAGAKPRPGDPPPAPGTPPGTPAPPPGANPRYPWMPGPPSETPPGTTPPGRTRPPDAPIVGTAQPREGANILGPNPYPAAAAASKKQRASSGSLGRRSTILGGFARSGDPTTRRTILSGGYH